MAKKKQSSSGSVLARFAFALAVAGLCPGAAHAQQSLETSFRTTGDSVTSVFEPQRQVIQTSSAVILDGRKEIAYGTVVSADGYLLTKASEIDGVGDFDVRVDRELYKKAKVVMTDATWDVALVKVDAEDLVPVNFAPDSKLERGNWVVVNGATSRTKRRILAGIISADAREIPPEGGAVLGVELKEEKGSLEVKAVSKDSGAEEAGIKEGDRITAVDGKKVKDIKKLSEDMKEMKAGAMVKVAITRDKKKIELEVRLSARNELFHQESRNDQMSGDYSKRRSGFPRVIQHDILAASTTMGGPVLDLDGRTVGMNIARANRAETFAIPVEELKGLAEGMVAQARK